MVELGGGVFFRPRLIRATWRLGSIGDEGLAKIVFVLVEILFVPDE